MILLSIALALLLDRLIGWPNRFVRLIGHPVIWAGNAISRGEKLLNKGSDTQKLWSGAALAFGLICASFLIAWIIEFYFTGLRGAVLLSFLIWPLLAAHSMLSHMGPILAALEKNDIEGARAEVSKIVGRNPKAMDENAIRRAGIESLAENTSDGVIAPLFWALLLGLPGIAAYKMINTLDSMIGYRNERYLYFGRIAARVDDVANFVPARLTALFFSVVTTRLSILKKIKNEAAKHRSPNAGWPETAMARLIGARLSGPRVYDGYESTDPWLNGEAPDPTNSSFRAAIAIFRKLVDALIVLFFVGALGYFIVYG